MIEPTCWWWVRHAPIPGAAGRLSGQQDVECDVSDTVSFRQLAEILPVDAVSVVSPLVRTRQTMAALITAGSRLAEPLVEPDFIEQSFGAWEGMSWTDMQASNPAAYATFWQDPTQNAPPGGESFCEQMRRTSAAIDRLCIRYAGRNIVCISHGGTIRAAVAFALGLTARQAMGISIDNLSVTRLDRLSEGLLCGVGSFWQVQAVNAPCRWIRRTSTC